MNNHFWQFLIWHQVQTVAQSEKITQKGADKRFPSFLFYLEYCEKLKIRESHKISEWFYFLKISKNAIFHAPFQRRIGIPALNWLCVLCVLLFLVNLLLIKLLVTCKGSTNRLRLKLIKQGGDAWISYEKPTRSG